jgi:hypothetical protein
MQHAGGRTHLDNIDAKIVSLRRKYPFRLVQTITQSLEIPASTIYSHLVEQIALKFSDFVGFAKR